jgi:hypothetical protein
MAGRWRIFTHHKRGWIIQSGSGPWLVGPDLGRVLQPLAGTRPDLADIQGRLSAAGWGAEDLGGPVASLARELDRILNCPAPRRRAPGRRAIWLRLTVLPPALVRPLATLLAPLTATPHLAGMTLVGAGLYAVAGVRGTVSGSPDVTGLTAGLGLFFLLGLWHELGHAAALRREGYPPGRIGLGVLLVLPVLFADVSPVAALPRGGRLRVDLAGVSFQLGAGGWFFAAGALNPHLPGAAAMQLAGLLALPAVAWSLLPVIRADGYWFLADLLDLPDLERPAPPDRSHRLRAFLIGHRLLSAFALLLMGAVLPWRYHGWIIGAARQLEMSPGVGVALLAGFVALVWWGLLHRLLLLFSAGREDARRWRMGGRAPGSGL